MANKKYITKIFLIDDDPIYSNIIKLSLAEIDAYDIHVFRSGEEFFSNIHFDPDIVIIDYNLPGMSGLDILKKIKHIDPNISTIFQMRHGLGVMPSFTSEEISKKDLKDISQYIKAWKKY